MQVIVEVEEIDDQGENKKHDWSDARESFMRDFLGCVIRESGFSDWHKFRVEGVELETKNHDVLRSTFVSLAYEVLKCREKWGWSLETKFVNGVLKMRKVLIG